MFSVALYYKWDVNNGFAYVLQFFSLISGSLGGVVYVQCVSRVKTLITQVQNRADKNEPRKITTLPSHKNVQ